MFEARKWRTRLALQLFLTILVLPFLFPLIAMRPGLPRRHRLAQLPSSAVAWGTPNVLSQ